MFWSILGLSLKGMDFCHRLKFSTDLSLQPDGVNLWYLKLKLIDQTEFINSTV